MMNIQKNVFDLNGLKCLVLVMDKEDFDDLLKELRDIDMGNNKGKEIALRLIKEKGHLPLLPRTPGSENLFKKYGANDDIFCLAATIRGLSKRILGISDPSMN